MRRDAETARWEVEEMSVAEFADQLSGGHHGLLQSLIETVVEARILDRSIRRADWMQRT